MTQRARAPRLHFAAQARKTKPRPEPTLHQTVLRPGMVLAIEPTVCYRDGGDIICIEEQVLITSEVLTAGAPTDLYPRLT